jgi:hypothetical protein
MLLSNMPRQTAHCVHVQPAVVHDTPHGAADTELTRPCTLRMQIRVQLATMIALERPVCRTMRTRTLLTRMMTLKLRLGTWKSWLASPMSSTAG